MISLTPYFRDKLTRRPINGADNEHAMFITDDEDQIPHNHQITELREPNIQLAPFKQFIQWLYNHPLAPLASDHALTADTYLLAHTLRSETFRNDIVDAARAYHAANPDAPLGLRSMVKLANTLSPDDERNEGKSKLLEFLVAQMTYKIIVRGWAGSGFRGNQLLKRLFATSTTVTMWHLDRLHGMLDDQGFTGAVQTLDTDLRSRIKNEDEEMGDGDGWAVGAAATKSKVKRSGISLPPNPAAQAGCCFHEHKGRDSRCAAAMAID